MATASIAVSHGRASGRSASASSRSSGVSRSSAERPVELDEPSHRPPRAAAAWAGRLSPPKRESMTSGGASSSAFVPRPCRSATMRDERRRGVGRAPRGAPSMRRRRDRGQVGRQDEHGLGAGGDRLVAGRAQAVVEPGRPLAERSGAGVQGEGADLVVGRHDERLGDARRRPRRADRPPRPGASTRSRRSSASRTAPRRDFAPSSARPGRSPRRPSAAGDRSDAWAAPAVAQDRSAASRARPASSAMIVSMTTARMPSSAMAAASAASTRSRTKSVGDLRVQPRDAERAGLVAERGEHPVRRALERPPPTIGLTATTGRPARAAAPRPSRCPARRGSARPRRSGSTAR